MKTVSLTDGREYAQHVRFWKQSTSSQIPHETPHCDWQFIFKKRFQIQRRKKIDVKKKPSQIRRNFCGTVNSNGPCAEMTFSKFTRPSLQRRMAARNADRRTAASNFHTTMGAQGQASIGPTDGHTEHALYSLHRGMRSQSFTAACETTNRRAGKRR